MSSAPRPPDRRTFLALGAGALAVAVTPGLLRRPDRLVRRSIPVMGTVAEVAVRHRDSHWAQRAIDAAFAELRRVDRTMTRFREDSEVGRLNAASGRPVTVSWDTAEVLRAARRWALLPDSGFDPCLGEWTRGGRLWGSERPAAGGAVEEGEGAGGRWAAAALEVEAVGALPRARLLLPGTAVDLGAIAKGWAVDRAAEALRAHGVFHALVNAGGDLAALGVDEYGEPWRVGVRDPDDPRGVVAVLEVADAALATSGLYEQGAHLLDPHTGEPLRTARRSFTVQAPTCIDADAGATAAFALGPGRASALLEGGAPGARIVHSIEGGPPWMSA